MMISKRTRSVFGLVTVLVVALLLSACGGGSTNSESNSTNAAASNAPKTDATPKADAASDGNVTVQLKNFAFAPNELRVNVGTTVTFVNGDQIAHNVVQTTAEAVNDGGYGFESPQIMSGDSWSYTFDKPGTYPILCTVGGHYVMGMTGTVIVE